MSAVVHIAGVDVRIGSRLRQRCSWCGKTLLDYDLAAIAVPVGQDPTPGTWMVGALVSVEGGASFEVPHTDGHALPQEACAQLDPDVTA